MLEKTIFEKSFLTKRDMRLVVVGHKQLQSCSAIYILANCYINEIYI